MKRSNNKLLRVIYTLLLAVLLSGAALAAETDPALDLRVFPGEACEITAAEPAPYTSRVRQAANAAQLTASESILENIKRHEGFVATPYADSVGSSIGYGCQYSLAVELLGENCAPITEEQGDQLLRYAVSAIENALNSYLARNSIRLNQNQFDALVSFTYNVGTGWLYSQNADGTPYKLRALLEGDPAEWTEQRVQEAFGTWVYANGTKLPGLVARRAEEAALFCTSYTAPSGPFTDVPEDTWYTEWVLTAYEKGFLHGVGGGLFLPGENMTRAQLVVAMANFAGVDLSGYGAVQFTDVPAGQWYTAAVDWAVQTGLINGMGDGTFHPGDPILREHACNILARYLRSRGLEAESPVSQFQDHEQIQESARDNVYYCAALGLINGMGNNTFAPELMMNRAQLAKILVCMDQLFA